VTSILLSKSKYLNGLQCLKLLWLEINNPETLPQVNLSTQFVFDQGHLVGELAKKLFPDGVDIPTNDFMENTAATRKPNRSSGVPSRYLRTSWGRSTLTLFNYPKCYNP